MLRSTDQNSEYYWSSRRPSSIERAATTVWEVDPGATEIVPRAYFLPGQLERVTHWQMFKEHPGRAMIGGHEKRREPTRAMLIKDAVLIDGRIHKGMSSTYFHSKRSLWPIRRIETEIERGALYCDMWGSKFFAAWLIENAVTYLLAAAEATPVTTVWPIYKPHMHQYENRLGMAPSRQRAALIREAVVFDDFSQPISKRPRADIVRRKLLSNVDDRPHPGVFILRGASGEPRLLKNELEIAERVRSRRGFRVIDPEAMDVAEIIAVCAGAETVMGVEGGQLAHGLAVLEPGRRVLTLQPPNRFFGYYKWFTDRDDQFFGFVVGRLNGDGFIVDPDEVERTLDLFPANQELRPNLGDSD